MSIKDYDSFREHYKNLSGSFKDELGVELSDKTKGMYEGVFGRSLIQHLQPGKPVNFRNRQ